MKRVLETDDMGETEIMIAYNNLKALDLVNDYFLDRSLELCPSGRLLDVGCGTGKMLRSVAGDYEKHGIDISPKLIDFAKENDSNTSYQFADSNKIPYSDNYFDLIMCHSMLHHLEDPKKTIDEIMRVSNS